MEPGRPARDEGRGGSVSAWHLKAPAGVECFRATALGHSYGRHTHDAYAIGAFESGVGGNKHCGTTYYFTPGVVIAMNPDEPHTGYPADGQTMTYRMFYVTPEALRELLPGMRRQPYLRGPLIPSAEWARRVLCVHRSLEAASDALEQRWALESFLREFFAAHAVPTSVGVPPPPPKAIQRAKEYLRANYARSVTVEELAQVAGLSRAHVIRAFHRTVGLPPHLWLVQVRIAEARRRLVQGTPIAQVAQEAGFADQAHLTRHFKSARGITPGRYAPRRKSKRASP